ncbi:hypothetical protein CROQUDRAFT_224263 [Cronartium quercuum f. sp. fusiforme G11]|uniref:Uncharacterized protein n=1 Tax=Cronartium quercuum f. sp. fusiforme G11 TaxID=708437 RepID=A0A9P6NE95_9BASI|nr:hypothetical protein CROQUDRAFT_224263 [Cronartium quercuum f. sp. fusiforme G11]
MDPYNCFIRSYVCVSHRSHGYMCVVAVHISLTFDLLAVVKDQKTRCEKHPHGLWYYPGLVNLLKLLGFCGFRSAR